MNARDIEGSKSVVSITLEVKNLDALRTVINRLSSIRGVSEVSRNGRRKNESGTDEG